MVPRPVAAGCSLLSVWRRAYFMIQFLTREEQQVEMQAFTVQEPDPSMLHNGYTPITLVF